MADKFVCGNVNADGSIQSGSGFTVVPESGNGVYTVVFSAPFSQMPTVVTDQQYPSPGSWNQFSSDGGDTRDNTVLIAVASDKFKFKTGNNGGAGTDRNFSFIAVGPA